MHLGHQKLIEAALAEARALHSSAFVYTFKPHPQIALRPEQNRSLITTYGERFELLSKTAIAGVIEEPFSREFSQTPAATFFEKILMGLLRAKVIVVGYDFSFGKNRTGNLELLRAYCEKAQVKLVVVPPFELDGVAVSSSRIREALLKGDVASAHRLLGHPFFYRGIVIRGEGRGKKLGVPTANLQMPEESSSKCLLPFGVYATTVDGLPSATNIGVRPTFEDHQPVAFIESHIIGGSEDLYGRTVEVQFLKRIREEKKFASFEELKAQIAKDISEISGFFSKNSGDGFR